MWQEEYDATDLQTNAKVYKTDIPLTKLDGTKVTGTLHFISNTGSHWITDDKGILVVGADSASGTYGYGKEAFFWNRNNIRTVINDQSNEDAYQNLDAEGLSNTIKQSINQVMTGLGPYAKGTNIIYTGVGFNYIVNTSKLFKSSVQTNPDETKDPEEPTPIDPTPLEDTEIRDAKNADLRGAEWQFLRYPHDIDPEQKFHWMKIQTLRHVPVKASDLPTGAEVVSDNLTSNRLSTENRYKFDEGPLKGKYKTINTILLPMHPSITETNSVDWGADSLTSIQAAGAQLANTTIRKLAANQPVEAATNFFNQVRNTLIEGSKNESIKNALLQYYSGQAVGANLFGRATGAVINPNLEVIFNGPRIRSFNYSFRFTPRDRRESQEVHKIITTFRKNMAVQKASTALFLKAPNVFKITYMVMKEIKNSNIQGTLEEIVGENPWLTKIKVCALTDMSVDYTPDGSYSTFFDNSPTSVGLTLSFQELEPIFANENEYMSSSEASLASEKELDQLF